MTNAWLNRAEYPFTSCYFSVDAQQLHYIDEGQGETILFVHGTPSWSFDFRNVIKSLRKDVRCVAIDHIGFGLSSKPEHYDYSTINHSRTVEKFILEKQLTDITLVVHDFGGPIGLHVAIQHPERFKRMVILNSWMWSSATDPDFIRMSKILKSPLLPLLYRYLNFSPRFILPSSFGDHKLPQHLSSQYTRPFASRRQRNGAIAFAKSLLLDQAWFESMWEKRHVLQQKPVQLIWGMKDPVLKPTYLEKFMSGFPLAKAERIATAGHFPQEEQPEMVSEIIRKFIQG